MAAESAAELAERLPRSGNWSAVMGEVMGCGGCGNSEQSGEGGAAGSAGYQVFRFPRKAKNVPEGAGSVLQQAQMSKI